MLTSAFLGSTAARAASGYATFRLNGEMVDTCTQYSAAEWNNVLAGAPSNMYGLGLYIGGAVADDNCFEPDASYISTLRSGWHIAPIWDGLQAYCNLKTNHPMSKDASTADQQGTNSADAAKGRLNALGFGSGTIVYLDIEAYGGYGDYTTTCRTVAGRYLNGFVHELHSLGYQAGIYSSACSPNMQYYTTINNPPDDGWYGDYNGVDSANTSGSTNSSCIATTSWANHHRIHQYHDGHNQNISGYTVYVDDDCADGDTDSAMGPVNSTCG